MSRDCTVLVAGSSGQIGSALATYLLNKTDHFVIGIDIEESQVIHPRFEFQKGSVLDLNFLEAVSTRISESSKELKGVVNAFVFPEYNNALPS